MKSPTSITQVFSLDQSSIDTKYNNKNVIKTTPKADFTAFNDSFANLSVSEDSSLDAKLKATKDKLAWLEWQKTQDKEEYSIKLAQAKEDYRRQAYAKYLPKNGSALEERMEQDEQLEENQRQIEALRSDNLSVRKQIRKLRRDMEELHVANQRLELSNKMAQDAVKQLEEQTETFQAVHDKLQENISILKTHLQAMKDEYRKRCAYCTAEENIRAEYEKIIAKVAKHVSGRRKLEILSAEITETIVDGQEEARDNGHVPKLLDKVQAAMNEKKYGSDDESDYESDSDSDDED